MITARGELGLIVIMDLFPSGPNPWVYGSGAPQAIPIVNASGAFGFYADGWRARKASGQDSWVDDNGNAIPTTEPVLTAAPLGDVQFHYAFVPLWFLAGLLAIVPAIAWREMRRMRGVRRQLAGICVRCGYDLRATPDRCPECGTVTKLA